MTKRNSIDDWTSRKCVAPDPHQSCRDMNITNRGFEVFTLLVDNDADYLRHVKAMAKHEKTKEALAARLEEWLCVGHPVDNPGMHLTIGDNIHGALLHAIVDTMDWEAIAEHYIAKAKNG